MTLPPPGPPSGSGREEQRAPDDEQASAPPTQTVLPSPPRNRATLFLFKFLSSFLGLLFVDALFFSGLFLIEQFRSENPATLLFVDGLVTSSVTWLLAWHSDKVLHCDPDCPDGPRPFRSTRHKIGELILILVFAAVACAYLRASDDLPRSLQERNLFLLVSLLFCWTGRTYLRTVKTVRPLLTSRHLLSAAEAWSAIPARLLFQLPLIVVVWLSTDILLPREPRHILEVLPRAASYVAPFVDHSWIQDCLQQNATRFSVAFAASSGTMRSLLQLAANGIPIAVFLVNLALLRSIHELARFFWTQLHTWRTALQIPRSPGMLLFVVACSTAVAMALYLLAAYPFYLVDHPDGWPHVPRPWAYAPGVALVAALLSVLLRMAPPIRERLERASQSPKVIRPWGLLVALFVLFEVTAAGFVWLDETDRVAGSQPAVLHFESSIQGLVSTAGDEPPEPTLACYASPAPSLTRSRDAQDVRGAFLVQATTQSRPGAPRLRPLAAIGIAWLLALFTMVSCVLPHSFAYDLRIRNRAWRDSHPRATLKAGVFLYQCFFDNPVALIAGVVLHVGATIAPLYYVLLDRDGFTPTLAAVAASSLPLCLKPIIVGYLNQSALFARAAARKIAGLCLAQLDQHLLVVGAGNLGRSVLAKHWRHQVGLLRFSLSNGFAIFVDADGQLQTLTLQAVVLDSSASVFAATYPWDGRLSVGYVRISEAESSRSIHPMLVSPKGDHSSLAEDELGCVCYPGICADGAHANNYDVLGWRRATNLFVATGEVEPAICVLDLIASSIPKEPAEALPGCVLRISSGTTYREVARRHRASSPLRPYLPLYPSPDEAENLVRQLNVARTSDPDGSDPPLRERNVLIVGGGRRVSHVCRALLGELDVTTKEALRWIRQHVFLLTSDPYVQGCLHPRFGLTEGAWRVFLYPLYQISLVFRAIPIRTRCVARIEYPPLREEVFRLARNSPGLDVIAFGDQDSSTESAVWDVAHDLGHAEFGDKARVFMSVNAEGHLPSRIAATRVSDAPIVREVVHDEVVAAEVISAFEIFRPGASTGSPGKCWSLYVCEDDVPGVLLWKVLVLGGVSRTRADALVRAALGALPIVPSWHYYFTESGLCLFSRGAHTPRVGFRFRAGFSLETRPDDDGPSAGGAIRAVCAADWTGQEWHKEGGIWWDCLGTGEPRGCTMECSTLCPLLRYAQKPTNGDRESVAALPTDASIDVICDGFHDPGRFAAMLCGLMGMKRMGQQAEVDVGKPRMNIRFVKSNEFCGPRRTLCTIHGETTDTKDAPDARRPESKGGTVQGGTNCMAHIVRVQVEGKSAKVGDYWRLLRALLDESDGGRPACAEAGDKRVWLRSGYHEREGSP